jgi:lactate dehydrogenase-like 2-hydroxyacid dehydrogenase
MSGTNVYVTRMLPEAGIDLLRRKCERVEVNALDRPHTREELLEAVPRRDGVLCQLADRVDAALMDAAGSCKVFSNFAVGFDNIDVPEATRRRIVVTNTPDVLTDAVADLTWALILAVARRVLEGDRMTRTGKFTGWAPMMLLGTEVTGKTLGLLGAGRIGAAVGVRARGFRMPVIYADPVPSETLKQEVGARRVTTEALFEEADFLSVHVPLRESTRHAVGERLLSMMKPTAFLVNTSRGPVIDEKTLVKFLKAGRIAGAGFDVYENEPKLASGLAKLPNVVLLPHIGSATVETRSRMSLLAAENLVAVLEGRRPRAIVNPEALER